MDFPPWPKNHHEFLPYRPRKNLPNTIKWFVEEFKDNDKYTPFRECNVSKLQSSPVVIDYVYNFLSIQNSENLNSKAGFLLTLLFDYALDCGKGYNHIVMENALGINFPKEKLTD